MAQIPVKLSVTYKFTGPSHIQWQADRTPEIYYFNVNYPKRWQLQNTEYF